MSGMVLCNKKCDANVGDFCMWKADEILVALAKDKDYKMCEYLRAEVLKRESEVSGNEYDC